MINLVNSELKKNPPKKQELPQGLRQMPAISTGPSSSPSPPRCNLLLPLPRLSWTGSCYWVGKQNPALKQHRVHLQESPLARLQGSFLRSLLDTDDTGWKSCYHDWPVRPKTFQSGRVSHLLPLSCKPQCFQTGWGFLPGVSIAYWRENIYFYLCPV